MLAVVAWMAGMLLLRIINRCGREIKLPVGDGVLLLTILYFTSLISITLIPLPFSTNRRPIATDLNFVPVITTAKIFLHPFRYNRMALLPDIMENILGNFLMFIPMGILLPMLHQKFQSALRVILTACGISLFIELTQWVGRYFGNYRHVDVDDVILNTLGAAFGCFIFSWLVRQRVQDSPTPWPEEEMTVIK